MLLHLYLFFNGDRFALLVPLVGFEPTHKLALDQSPLPIGAQRRYGVSSRIINPKNVVNSANTNAAPASGGNWSKPIIIVPDTIQIFLTISFFFLYFTELRRSTSCRRGMV